MIDLCQIIKPTMATGGPPAGSTRSRGTCSIMLGVSLLVPGPALAGGFVHDIDPVLVSLGSLRTYWYGLAYAAGFVGVLIWFARHRQRLGMTRIEVYELGIAIVVGVLVCGRAFEIVVYEWAFYRGHLGWLFSYWRGGMASHGVLVGCALGMWLFCRRRHKPFLSIADEVVFPGAVFLALGRIGNFIRGKRCSPRSSRSAW